MIAAAHQAELGSFRIFDISLVRENVAPVQRAVVSQKIIFAFTCLCRLVTCSMIGTVLQSSIERITKKNVEGEKSLSLREG